MHMARPFSLRGKASACLRPTAIANAVHSTEPIDEA